MVYLHHLYNFYKCLAGDRLVGTDFLRKCLAEVGHLLQHGGTTEVVPGLAQPASRIMVAGVSRRDQAIFCFHKEIGTKLISENFVCRSRP